jgi:hypothetical protein
MTLYGRSKLYKHPKANTLYLCLPAKMIQDSACFLKVGDVVKLKMDPQKKTLTVEKNGVHDEH